MPGEDKGLPRKLWTEIQAGNVTPDQFASLYARYAGDLIAQQQLICLDPDSEYNQKLKKRNDIARKHGSNHNHVVALDHWLADNTPSF